MCICVCVGTCADALLLVDNIFVGSRLNETHISVFGYPTQKRYTHNAHIYIHNQYINLLYTTNVGIHRYICYSFPRE